MKTTDYAGIDYGMGKSNVDNETGIRFGVIGQNSRALNHDATEDIWQHGRDLSHEQYVAEFKAKLRSAMEDNFSAHSYDGKPSPLDEAVESAFDAVDQDLNDRYECDSSVMLYERDGYRIQTSETELWVLKSPYFTHAQYCSPCAPGAGNLDTACPDGPKTYCLGPEWFDGNKAPYPVHNVSDVKAA